MSASQFWDQRFAGETFKYGLEPNAFLRAEATRLAPGSRVLVPGDGEGRNGVWLAQQGHRVCSVDASPVGLDKALRLASAASTSMSSWAIWRSGRRCRAPGTRWC